MNRLLAVAARELRERWLLFPAALVLGLNPLVLPAFGVDRQAMPILGLLTAVGLGTAAAVVIGSTMLARDAANGRLGFLFSRPLTWRAIWGGKWLAALVLVTASGALAAIPFMAAYPPQSHGGSWLRAVADAPGWAFFLCLLGLAVGIANFTATAYRSRSPWLALDLVLLAAGLWVARQYVAPLWRYGILGRSAWSYALAPLPLALALLVGSAVQVAVGRTDVRRAHRALSLAFWAVVGLTLAASAGYWQWVLSAAPSDLTGTWLRGDPAGGLTRDPAGRWIWVEGTATRGGFYPYGFLIDTASGLYVARPEREVGKGWVTSGMLFSADGRYAAMPLSGERGIALERFELEAGPRAIRVSLESSPPVSWGMAFALSPAGDFVFVVHESGASIYALPSGRRVATTTITPGWRAAAVRFADEARARVWLVPWSEASGDRLKQAEMRVLEMAVDGRTSATTFPLAAGASLPRRWGIVVPDATGQRIVTYDDGVHLRNASTGALLATLETGDVLAAGGSRVSTAFLSDGRVVVGVAAAPSRPQATLRVFNQDGSALGQTTLELRSLTLNLGPEVAPGRILVSSFWRALLQEDTLVVDLTAGRIVERLSGLRPTTGSFAGPFTAATGAGPGSVQFFRDAAGRVVRIDFASGARTTVAGPGAVRGERIAVRW